MAGAQTKGIVFQVLELLAYFTYCSPTISPQLWSLWPQIVTALNDWAVDFFENVSCRAVPRHIVPAVRLQSHVHLVVGRL